MKQHTFPQVSAHTSIVTGLVLCAAMAILTRHVQPVSYGVSQPTATPVPARTAEQDFARQFEARFVGRPESIATTGHAYTRYQMQSVYYFFNNGQLVLTSRTGNPSLPH